MAKTEEVKKEPEIDIEWIDETAARLSRLASYAHQLSYEYVRNRELHLHVRKREGAWEYRIVIHGIRVAHGWGYKTKEKAKKAGLYHYSLMLDADDWMEWEAVTEDG